MMDRILGALLSDAERAAVRLELRSLVGVRWKHKGRSQNGIDCLGLLWLAIYRVILASRGIALPKPADDYGRTPHNKRLRDELTRWLGPSVPLTSGESIENVDVVTMRWTGDEHHVGAVVDHPFHGRGLIHADNTAAGGPRVVEHGIDPVWRRRLIEGWSL